jgi:hypothetical protein
MSPYGDPDDEHDETDARTFNDDVEYLEDVLCIHETAKALLVKVDDKQLWVPKSVIKGLSEIRKKGDEGVLIVAQWFAEKENLV